MHTKPNVELARSKVCLQAIQFMLYELVSHRLFASAPWIWTAFHLCIGEGTSSDGLAPLQALAVGMWGSECAGCPPGGALAGSHADLGVGSRRWPASKNQR